MHLTSKLQIALGVLTSDSTSLITEISLHMCSDFSVVYINPSIAKHDKIILDILVAYILNGCDAAVPYIGIRKVVVLFSVLMMNMNVVISTRCRSMTNTRVIHNNKLEMRYNEDEFNIMYESGKMCVYMYDCHV